MESCNGKLFVYASSFVSRGKKFEPVRVAAEKIARHLGLSFEVRTFRKKFESVYVYYTSGDEEPIPIYCVGERSSNIEEIYTSLRNMMFVLSFHPRHLALKQIRKEIMLFS